LASIAQVLEADADARRYSQERIATIKESIPFRATSVI
jgi:hypothetical protein